MNKAAPILMFFLVVLLWGLNGCVDERSIATDFFSMDVLSNWALIEKDSMKYVFKKDTVFLKINIYREEKMQNILLRTPEEYIKTEDGNLLSNFAFSEPNTIYTDSIDIPYVKQTASRDSLYKSYNVEKSRSPVVQRCLKVADTLKGFEGIDYLCEFKYGEQVKWLPVTLPAYFKEFHFIIDTTPEYYKKVYYPKVGNNGKIGFVFHSNKNNYTMIVQSSIISASSPLIAEIKDMINSIKIIKP